MPKVRTERVSGAGRRIRVWAALGAGGALAGAFLAPVVGATACGARWLDVGEPAPHAPAGAVAALSGDAGFARTRLGTALVLEGVAPVLVVTGAGWGGDDAYEMVEAASAAGLRGDRVVAETTSRDTQENILRLRELAEERGWREILVVTSAAHTRRVRLLAGRLAPGLAVRVVSVPGEPPLTYQALVLEYTRLLVQSLIVW